MKQETQELLMNGMFKYLKKNFVQRKDTVAQRIFSTDKSIHGFESAPYVAGVYIASALGIEKEVIMEYFDLIDSEYDNTLRKAHGLVNNRIRKDLSGSTTKSKELTVMLRGEDKHLPDNSVIDRRITNYIKILSNYMILEVVPKTRGYVNLERNY